MAFKMRQSPHKAGIIEGTSAHKAIVDANSPLNYNPTLIRHGLKWGAKIGKKVFKKGKELYKKYKKSKVETPKTTTTTTPKTTIKTDPTWKAPHYPAGTGGDKITDIIVHRGSQLDKFVKGKGPTTYTKESITQLPTTSHRFAKVQLPNKTSQVFYESSGRGLKEGSKSKWIPFEGTTPIPSTPKWFAKTGTEGVHKTFGHMKTKFEPVYIGGKIRKKSIGVYQQLKDKGLDPWKEVRLGNLKVKKFGQGFNYGSKEYTKISRKLEQYFSKKGL